MPFQCNRVIQSAKTSHRYDMNHSVILRSDNVSGPLDRLLVLWLPLLNTDQNLRLVQRGLISQPGHGLLALKSYWPFACTADVKDKKLERQLGQIP